MQSYDSVAKISVVLMVCCSFGHSDACDSGWFGDKCQYQCHCAGSTKCEDDGSCSAGCEDGWFGPACQYNSMGYNLGRVAKPSWLSDNDDTTCNDGTINTSIYATLETPIPLTWIRVVVRDENYIDKVRLFHLPQGSNQPMNCPESRKAKVNYRTLDITCKTSESAGQIILDGEGIRNLCSLYISGGRNVALKQKTYQSSTFESWNQNRWLASHAVDGNTDFSGNAAGTCTHTNANKGRGYWTLTFASRLGVDITRFLIYNRQAQCCKDRLKYFKLTAWSVSEAGTPYTYTDRGLEAKPTYTVIASPKLSFPVKYIRVDVSQNSHNKILTLCEFQAFGEIQCGAGKFGRECEKTCNCADSGESCFVHSGGCPSGCAADFTGEDCSVQTCSAGRYGPGCTEICSTTCSGDDNDCDQKDGACSEGCDPGYTGTFCEHNCPTGKYGANCAEQCNANCGGGGNACHHIRGTCTNGCDDGFLGDMCDIPCSLGKYGPKCSEDCNTNCGGQNNDCAPRDGKCTYGCDDGYSGEKCENKCPAGMYGPGCAKICNINCAGQNNVCHHVNGTCINGCDNGYLGNTCMTKCRMGTYGQRCSETCSDNCKGLPKKCNHINGACTIGCQDGYRNPKCDEICWSGWYGPECSQQCSSKCKDKDCNNVNGMCTSGCLIGYKGDMCTEKCGLGKYGMMCKDNCSEHCAGDGSPCNHISGYCNNKCDPGYRGDRCHQECYRRRYGERCSKYCSVHCAGTSKSCSHVDGTCDEGCDVGYTGLRCENKCAIGYFGEGCKQICSKNCAGNGKACNHINGRCNSGCVPGYRGDTCTQKCQTGRYGHRCSRYCSRYCVGQGHPCHHVHGTCDLCEAGYQGAKCERTCDTGKYGAGCRNQCSEHCAGRENTTCDPVSGHCKERCDPGYQGSLCIHECNRTTYGHECAMNCSTSCANNDCNHVTGLCDACYGGHWGGLCDKQCNKTTFGTNCAQTCSIHCGSQLCHHVTGICESCVENRIGDFCEQLKQTGGGGDNSTAGAVIGVLFVVLLALTIVAGIFYWRHRQAKQASKTDENGVGMKERSAGTTYANMVSGTSSGASTDNQSKRAKPVRTLTFRRKDGFEEESEEDSDNDVSGKVSAPVHAGDTSVPVDSLKAYILQHSADSHFKDEFTSIPMANSSPQTCALLPDNTKKNRYKNILPYDASRVLLNVQDGKKHSDYINASYIKGYNNDVAFIASQGPNDFILYDFVRMLWEQNVNRVVMLTNLVELGKKKCNMYWPVDGEEEFGEVTVRLLTTHVYAEYTIRQMRLSKSGEPSRNLTQFHFTAWPDKSVPESPWGLVDLHQRVMATPGSGALVVHCSAGVGRTGTFIGLCNLLQEAEATGKMDFRSTLWKLRQDRMHTIQTIAQYAYLHKVAYVAYMTAGSTIKVKDIYASLDSLEEGTVRSYKQEFEAVLEACNATTIRSNETSDEAEENVYQNTGGTAVKGKDRLSNILPNKAYRPLLIAEVHHEDTYINAVLVPNLMKDSHDILTQLPLPSTVTDFWRLVTQFSVSLVVAFDTDSRHTDETIAEFFPTSEAEPFENDRFKVVTKPPTDGRLAKEFFLTVHQKIVPGMESLSSEKKRTLTLLLCKSAQLLELDPDSLLELQESIKQRRPGGQSRTIFMCRNGADQSGLMCVQSILLDRLETDQCLAVPYVVGAIKAIRPQIIPTVEQYKCLYKVLRLAHENQNVYGNVGDMS